MLKELLKYVLQKSFGFKNYLLIFSAYSIQRSLRGKYELPFEYFKKIIPDRGIILDIGANIGITMVPLAKAKRNAYVIGFEPISENYMTTKRIIKIFKADNAEIRNVALSDSPGDLTMVMPIKHGAKQQGLSKVSVGSKTENGIHYIVPALRLDDIFDKHEKVSGIKIDVENFELEVLRGGIRLLSIARPVIYCELWPNEKRSQVFEFLLSIGYTANIFDEHSNSLRPVNIQDKNLPCNFIFTSDN